MEEHLNPHQFGDQEVLFHAPLGQPERGLTKGHPAARIYRSMTLDSRDMHDLNNSRFGWDNGVPAHKAAQEILERASKGHQDRGHDTSLGIHWQHDLAEAHDYADYVEGQHDEHPFILEADHPGHQHVVDFSHDPKAGPPKGFSEYGSRRGYRGSLKDFALIHDTVGPHSMLNAMLPEVPIRPGAPLRVHAVHIKNDNTGDYERVPVQFEGHA